MRRAIVLDLNETLLDMSGLDPEFARLFGDRAVRREWFSQVLQMSLVATLVDQYRSFDKLAVSGLAVVARQRGKVITDEEIANVMARMRELAMYPDVRPALERLRDAGFTPSILSNSTAKSAAAHLEHNGMRDLVGEVMSVKAVKRYKPAREAYEHAAEALAMKPAGIRIVAAHAWDVTGAMAAGCRAAFVRRPHKALDPAAKAPDIVGDDLRAVVDRILESD